MNPTQVSFFFLGGGEKFLLKFLKVSQNIVNYMYNIEGDEYISHLPGGPPHQILKGI